MDGSLANRSLAPENGGMNGGTTVCTAKFLLWMDGSLSRRSLAPDGMSGGTTVCTARFSSVDGWKLRRQISGTRNWRHEWWHGRVQCKISSVDGWNPRNQISGTRRHEWWHDRGALEDFFCGWMEPSQTDLWHEELAA